jgi:flagellar hook-associated protein 2
LAGDAAITIDGLLVTSKSNTVSGAISGLTLNLVAASPKDAGGNQTAANVTVATNTAGIQTSLQTFMDSYNTLKRTIDTLSNATADEDGNLTVSAAFTGDSLPRSLMSDIRSQLTQSSAGTGQLAVLSQMGVLTDKETGELTLDTKVFNDRMAIPGMAGQVQQLFSGTTSTNGLLARMGSAVDPYVKSGTGLLDQRSSNLTNAAASLKKQQAALDIHVASLTATLTAKYNAMDLLVGQMKATASNITSFFASLDAQKSAS